MLKISYGCCSGLFPAISAQFTLEMRVAAQNHEKFTKTPSGSKFCHEILETPSYHRVKNPTLYLT